MDWRSRCQMLLWRARQDSNLRPSAPEADALSTELRALNSWLARNLRQGSGGCQLPLPFIFKSSVSPVRRYA